MITVGKCNEKFGGFEYPPFILSDKETIEIKCVKHNCIIKTTLKEHYSKKFGGCKQCHSDNNRRFKSITDFIEQCKEIHNNKYDYSIDENIKLTNTTKINVICPIHGEFEQIALSHFKGMGCRKCANKTLGDNRCITKDKFIERAESVHGKRYCYDLLPDKFKIKQRLPFICENHGIIYQDGWNHLQGHNCYLCGRESILTKIKLISSQEYKIRTFLDELQIKYTVNKHPKFLNGLELDIFIPEYNLAIEVNGVYWHSEQYKDKEYHISKLNLCESNGISLLQFYCKEVDDNFDTVKRIILMYIKNEFVFNDKKLNRRFYSRLIKDLDEYLIEEPSLDNIDNKFKIWNCGYLYMM